MKKELLKIRKVNSNDARGWLTLANMVWRVAYKNIFPEEVFIEKEKQLDERIKTFDKKIYNNNHNIAYVAEYDGNIIGIMCGQINSSYEYFKSDYADLGAIYIAPEFQKMGIGSAFKDIFEKWSRENGATKYVIGVLKDNIKARKVYELWGGKLSKYENTYVKLGVEYPEVFYTYDLMR